MRLMKTASVLCWCLWIAASAARTHAQQLTPTIAASAGNPPQSVSRTLHLYFTTVEALNQTLFSGAVSHDRGIVQAYIV